MQNNTRQIQHEKCHRDYLCIYVCPFGLIKKDENGFSVFVEEAAQKCIACGHCVAICKYGAVSINNVSSDALQRVPENLKFAKNLVESIFKTRRSIRKYKNKNIPKQLIQRIIEIASLAPSTCNQDSVNWLIVNGPKKVGQLAALIAAYFNKNKETAPSSLKQWTNKNDCILRNSNNVIIAHASTKCINPQADCIIAMSHLDLLAQTFGLGSCWAGLAMTASEDAEILDYLKIPNDHRIYAVLIMGLPKYKYERIPLKKGNPKVTWI